ncbi:unnamed protein product [Brugia timori]|uniref:Uncharacterized protein n=1 Tax=Brugia timori TaxID=42155 RepID=A0A3P7WI18_9BILA|nr:unnamed protein product [Brugia timori]
MVNHAIAVLVHQKRVFLKISVYRLMISNHLASMRKNVKSWYGIPKPLK